MERWRHGGLTDPKTGCNRDRRFCATLYGWQADFAAAGLIACLYNERSGASFNVPLQVNLNRKINISGKCLNRSIEHWVGMPVRSGLKDAYILKSGLLF